MSHDIQVQGKATFKADPLGTPLSILGMLPSGKLLCVRDGETEPREYDPGELYLFPTGPVDRPPHNVD